MKRMKQILSYLGLNNVLGFGGLMIVLLVIGLTLYSNVEKMLSELETSVSHLEVYGRKGYEPAHQYRHAYLEAPEGYPSTYFNEIVIAIQDATNDLGGKAVITKVTIGNIRENEIELAPNEVLAREVTVGMEVYGIVVTNGEIPIFDTGTIILIKRHSGDIVTADMLSIMSAIDLATYDSEGRYKGSYVTKVVMLPIEKHGIEIKFSEDGIEPVTD